MDITSIMGVLLFVLPGILAEKISHKVDFPSGKKRSEFGELINGIALSFPILFLTAVIVYWIYGYTNINDYLEVLYNMKKFFIFVSIALGIAIITGVIAGLSSDRVNKVINWFRVKVLRKMKIDGNSCWRRFLIDENKPRYVEIIKDGISYKGFLGPFSLPDEDREIILTNDIILQSDEWYDEKSKEYEYQKKFTKIVKTYIDVEKNIVVHDYDMSEYENWCDKMSNQSCPTNE